MKIQSITGPKKDTNYHEELVKYLNEKFKIDKEERSRIRSMLGVMTETMESHQEDVSIVLEISMEDIEKNLVELKTISMEDKYNFMLSLKDSDIPASWVTTTFNLPVV